MTVTKASEEALRTLPACAREAFPQEISRSVAGLASGEPTQRGLMSQ